MSTISTTQVCGDLGEAKNFNVFAFGNHTGINSDTEGRIAVGNNAYYQSYGIGDKLDLSTTRFDLIVGKSLFAENGTVFSGNTAIGTDALVLLIPLFFGQIM